MNKGKNLKGIIVVLLALFFIPVIVQADPIITYQPFLHDPVSPEYKYMDANYGTTSLNMGSFTYDYPISVPAGTNGLSPHISVSYNSHSATDKYSIVGSGWTLSDDYVFRDINYTKSDTSDDEYKLSLNGQSYDLIPINDSIYVTKIESYLHIEKKTDGDNSNGDYWIVKAKDGTAYTFGYTNQSEHVSTYSNNFVYKWSLEQVNDIHDNSIYYYYNEDPFPGDSAAVYMDKIEYNNDRLRSIEFEYETSDRENLLESYVNGNKFSQVRMLSDINVFYNDSLVRRYHFSYQNLGINTIVSVSNITQYGNDNSTALPPIKFEYEELTSGWLGDSTWDPPEKFLEDGYHEDEGTRFTDVNRDGLMDMVKGEDTVSGGSKTAYINYGSGWYNNDNWAPPAYIAGENGEDMGIRIVDLNNDGYPDILKGRYSASICGDSEKTAYINNGTDWVNNDSWQPPKCFVTSTGGTMGIIESDVNGDGLLDIVRGYEYGGSCSTDQRDTYINTGNGFDGDTTWRIPTCLNDNGGDDLGVRLVDINGDGLTDILRAMETSTGNCGSSGKDIWINTGTGWTQDHNWYFPTDDDVCFVAPYGNRELGVRLADVTGDGLVDILHGNNNNEKAWINNGTGWVRDDNWEPVMDFIDSDSHDLGLRLSDVNGDGYTDLLRGIDSTRHAWINNAAGSYLLKRIYHPLGGNITINYKPSTQLNNSGDDSFSDLGYNLWVVDSIEKFNGMDGDHQNLITISYNFSGGVHDYEDREFRGFKYAIQTKDNAIIQDRYHQSDDLKSKLYEETILNKSQAPFQNISYLWSSSTVDDHFISHLDAQEEYIFDGSTTGPKVVNTTFEYDGYGNINKTSYLGDISISGDEYYNYTEYAYNETAWIVNTPKKNSIYDSDFSKIREASYYYDNLGYGEPPIIGDITRIKYWLDTGSDLNEYYEYDLFRNVINSTDARGYSTINEYDSTGTFLTKSTNPKGHTIEYDYDFSTGNVLAEIDSNRIATNYTYDVFGRQLKEIKPYDSVSNPTKEYIYDFDGIAPESIVTKQKESGTDTYDTYVFYDGYGRWIQMKTDAESGQIVNNVYYDEDGLPVQRDNPYMIEFFENYSNPQTVNQSITVYDAVKRVVEVINPDGTSKSTEYDHWTEIVTDENGNKKEFDKDAYGRVITVREYNENEIYNTTYEYDSLGNLVKITDNLDNEWQYEFDSLGRRISQEDPDSGTVNYNYDANGNLISQTDEINTINMTYDALDRILTKEDIEYSYDVELNGTLYGVNDSTETTYVYDDRYRVTTETRKIDGYTFVDQLTYDSMDRVLNKSIPSKDLIYTYNDQNLVESISDVIDNFNYNSVGFIINKTYANNLVTEYSYDSENFRLEEIKTSSIQDLGYEFDSVGNIVKIEDSVNSKNTTMEYDDLDRLVASNKTGVFDMIFSYNSIGNLLGISDPGFYIGYDYLLPHAPSIIYEFNSIAAKKFTALSSDNKTVVFDFTVDNLSNDTDYNWSIDTGEGMIDGSNVIDNMIFNYIEYEYDYAGGKHAQLYINDELARVTTFDVSGDIDVLDFNYLTDIFEFKIWNKYNTSKVISWNLDTGAINLTGNMSLDANATGFNYIGYDYPGSGYYSVSLSVNNETIENMQVSVQ